MYQMFVNCSHAYDLFFDWHGVVRIECSTLKQRTSSVRKLFGLWTLRQWSLKSYCWPQFPLYTAGITGGLTLQTVQMPDWNSRDRPTMQLWDMSGLQDGLSAFNPYGENAYDGDLVEWLNKYRRPLQAALRRQEQSVPRALSRLGVGTSQLLESVAKVTGTHPYPHHRMLTASQAAELPEFMDAVSEITPGRAEVQEDDVYQYHPLLGAIVLQDSAVEDVNRITAVDNVASAIGMAAMGNIVDVKLQYEPTRGMWHWFGAVWRYDDEYYGQFMQRAQVAKVAALVRKKLGMVCTEGSMNSSFLEPYRLPDGYNPAAGCAVALDVLDRAAERLGTASIYPTLREFAKRGRPDDIRDKLAHSVSKATAGHLALEDLESIIPDRHGLQYMTSLLIEDALQLPIAERPSLRQYEVAARM